MTLPFETPAPVLSVPARATTPARASSPVASAPGSTSVTDRPPVRPETDTRTGSREVVGEAAERLPVLTFDVLGTPAPQGSKRGFYNQHTRRVQMVESSKRVAPWRQDVKHAAADAIRTQRFEQLHGPVELTVEFRLARPAGHYGTGRNAGALRASAPRYPAVLPDLDKLLRSTMDALSAAGVWADDSRVVCITTVKVYADRALPGATITVRGAR